MDYSGTTLAPGLIRIEPDQLGCILPAKLVELHHYWRRCRHGMTLPGRADFDPLDVPRHLGNLFLIDVSPEPRRYRYRLVGTAIVHAMGRDATGKAIDELYDPASLMAATAAFTYVATRRVPLYCRGNLPVLHKDHLFFDMLVLPLAADGETVDMLLGEINFDGQRRATDGTTIFCQPFPP
ncbi:MAG: PAS domain-containing protein [Azospirillum sp.]|nr:PAS domain-containing protein [Azospirillum sp.]